MKNFNLYKDKLLKIYKELNNIDINQVFEKLKSINLEDINKFDKKNFIIFIKTSKYTKSIISFIFFISFIFILILPSLKTFNSRYKLSRQYLNESNNLAALNDEFLVNKNKFKKISLAMNKIENYIIKKEKLIFLTNLFDELSKSTSVRLDLLKPINKEKESSICKISELNQLSKNTRANKNKVNAKKNNQAIYELKIYGNYLNILSFINNIQNYDIMIISNCLEVESIKAEGLTNSGIVKANLLLILPLR